MSAAWRVARWLAGAAALLLVALAVGAGLLWRELGAPHAGWDGPQVDLVIEPGLPAGVVLVRLAQAGVIRRAPIVRAWLVLSGRGDRLRAGEYRFEHAASPLEVLRRLEAGDVLLHAVTVPEGLTLVETATRFEEAGLAVRAELLAAFADPAPIRAQAPRAADLEGYLFPDTYHLSRGISAREIAATMVRRFQEVVGEGYAADARAVGLDLHRAVVLASLIERETGVAPERGRIARVFHNRLARGMKLDCDPTVIYALARAGRPPGTLTLADLQFDSPWNTYRVAGLPPGPIASPGRESLLAAVHPAPGDELYFVAAPAGGHRFSRALSEHQAAVAVWRRYCKSSR